MGNNLRHHGRVRTTGVYRRRRVRDRHRHSATYIRNLYALSIYSARIIKDPDNRLPIIELLAGLILFILAMQTIVASVTP